MSVATRARPTPGPVTVQLTLPEAAMLHALVNTVLRRGGSGDRHRVYGNVRHALAGALHRAGCVRDDDGNWRPPR